MSGAKYKTAKFLTFILIFECGFHMNTEKTEHALGNNMDRTVQMRSHRICYFLVEKEIQFGIGSDTRYLLTERFT